MFFSVFICCFDSIFGFLGGSIGKSTKGMVDLFLHALECVSTVALSVDSSCDGISLGLSKHVSAWNWELHSGSSGCDSGSNKFGLHDELFCLK